jgi:hypothetical protein
MNRPHLLCSFLALGLSACGAQEDAVTIDEARSALEESQVASQAATLTDGSVEI